MISSTILQGSNPRVAGKAFAIYEVRGAQPSMEAVGQAVITFISSTMEKINFF